MGLLRSIILLVLFFLVILLLPNIPPSSNVKFTEFHVAPSKPLEGPLALNTLLNNAERLFEDEIKGPEAFAVLDGELYTTLHGGYVAKVYEDQIIPVVKFGQSCENWWEEKKCGRPLGIRPTNDGHLIVADAYYGIFQYNVKTGAKTVLVDTNTKIEGKTAKIFNSVEVAKDGSIFWTDSSSDFTLEDGVFTLLADGSGRLIRYDPKTKRNTVLIEGLYFANGVALSPDEDFVIVAETGHSRIQRFYLKGPKKFTSDIFIDGLPGFPDNLRPNGRGGFFVPLILARDSNTPAITQTLAPFPLLRKLLARLLSLTQLFFVQIENIYPNYYSQRAIHFIGHFESVKSISPLRFTLLEVDVNGNVIESYHALDGSVTAICDVIAHQGYLYLGSPYNNYLGRIKLSKLGGKLKEAETSAPPVRSTTTTTTPKPTTTTTPKPTTTTTPKPTTTTTPKPMTTTTTTSKPKTTTPEPPRVKRESKESSKPKS